MLRNMVDVSIDVFGGYCPAIVPANLPPGAANIAQDVMFPQAGVRTRGGLGTGVAFSGADIPAGASINGLKTFLTSTGGRDLMIWDSLGHLFAEDPQGTLNLINSRPYQNLLYESQTLFSREYQAFFNSLGGFDIPRQYDGTYWDRVSQVGPGAAPMGADVSWAIVSISRAATTGIITLVVKASLATVNAATSLGQLLTINGVSADTSLDGSWPIIAIASSGSNTQIEVWGSPGTYQISAISRDGSGNVTATLETTPTFGAGASIAIDGVDDDSFDGLYTVGTVSGNNVTWVQSGSPPASVSSGGQLYSENYTGTLYDASNVVPGEGTTYPSGTGGIALVGNVANLVPPGSSMTLAGGTNPSWDATWVISTTYAPNYLPPGTPGLVGQGAIQGITQFYLDPGGSYPSSQSYGGTATIALAASNPAASGTAGPMGNISQGLHNVSVAFITRQGFITRGALPWSSWNAQGNFRASISGIPTGPPNVIQRLLLFTPAIPPPAVTGTFYSLPTGSTSLSTPTALSVMLIPDNVTTTATIDFSDEILISGFQAQYLFSQNELGESSFFLPYNSRTVWLGERNKVPNFNNLTFDGGFASDGTPDGWTPSPLFGANGSSAVADNLPVDWGDAYVITGTGFAILVGLITQSAYQDSLLAAILQPNTSYGVRARLACVAGSLTQGTINVDLYSPSLATTYAGLSVSYNQLTAAYAEFSANFALPAGGFATVPDDLELRVYAGGTPNNGGKFIIDSVEVFPVLTPFNSSTARLSRAFNPESFDSVTGLVQVRQGDGQQLRAGFPLRNSLYLAKDHYLGYVTDDGVNEPSSWQFTEVDATVGICGPNAVDWTEEWAVFAERSGFYICWGSDPVKITPEIQTDATNTGRVCWASINWAAAYTIWVRIDRVNKMILIGAPINGATAPNVVFMMDYRWLDTAEDIAGNPLVGYSAFTGKMLAHGKGRRWATWNITSNAMCFAEREDGSAQPFFGGVGNGTIFWQQDISINGSDNGAVVNGQYQTYATPSPIEEQQYQLRAHRKLLGYLKFRAWGAGTLNLAISTTQRSTILRGYTLSLNPSGDGERPVNCHGERFFITLSTSAVNQWFQLEKLIPCIKKDSSALVRGVSA